MYELNQRIDPATGESSRFENYDLHYELKCNSLSEENVIPAKAGIYTNCFDFTLTKVIDPTGLSWLNDSSRVYPLVIDASVGPNDPGTMADDATVGTVAWSNPDNAKISNDTYATVETRNYAGENITKLVKGGTVQGDDKSIGIVHIPTIEQYVSYGGENDLWGLAFTSDNINATDFGVVFSVVGNAGNDFYSHYLKATNFGFSILSGSTINGIEVEIEQKRTGDAGSYVVNVDHIRITVYYTEAASNRQ